jgi:hypothetical protein
VGLGGGGVEAGGDVIGSEEVGGGVGPGSKRPKDYDNPTPEPTSAPQSGTKNWASGLLLFGLANWIEFPIPPD